ncbi:terminase [Mesorhizobium sp. CN2-181]|uniref:terminase n=1 Tax=Mesorhizobium yinganensis TaxID=3157707 RepID=UPI0032B7A8EE
MAESNGRGPGDIASTNVPSEVRIYEAILRNNLAAFTQRAFRELSPAAKFTHNWHLEAIAWHLHQVAEGRCRRLLITLPPRSLKSTYASVAFPAYLLGRNPSMRVVCISYASDLLVQHANACRRLLRAPWYRRLFPSTVIDGRKDTETESWTTRSGYRLATTIGGSLTGRGGDVFIIDDPMKAQDAASEAGRNRVNTWFDETLNSRLDDKQAGSIIIVMQRLHEDDLAGHVLSRGEWTHLNLPAVAEDVQTIQTGSGSFHVRQVGDLLHPEREPQSVLDELRRSLGSIAFSAQYQQAPVPAGGNMIPWDWFVTYERPPERRYGDRIIQSWDTASKATELSDYSVGVTAMVSNGMVWILDVHRERLEYPALRKTIVRKRQEWRAWF